jgi:hypothetical protein
MTVLVSRNARGVAGSASGGPDHEQSRLVPARQNKRAADRSAAPVCLERMTYFKLVIAVRSAESLTMPAAPHQLEPKPPGLVGVMKDGLKFLVA